MPGATRSTLPSPAIDRPGPELRAAAAPGPEVETEEGTKAKVDEAFERTWGVIVWNDPVNTMTFVTYVFRKVLKMDRSTAERHMLEVHRQGKSLVATETRERAEFLVHQIQSFGLKATLERA